jgi:membrane-bound lytic murein transglycosylase D
MTSIIRTVSLTFSLFCLGAALETGAGELFPLPDELEPDVAFWASIFTEYDSDQGVLHDNRNLAVIYERVDIPARSPRSRERHLVGQRRTHYRKILEKLARGAREGLTAEEERVLGLWPADVTSAELASAATRIRFQRGLSDRFRAGMQRAGRYRAHVHAEFAKLGVPVDLAALPHVESSYNPEARSHVGASGIWQFTRGTGRRFMRIDHVLDERNDPYTATIAAGKLLAYNHSITGNWPMAITAYNHGLSGVRRAMRTHGDTEYAEIFREYKSRTFGFASRNFYVAFLAALRIDRDPDRYFPGLVPDAPIDYDTMTLDAFVPADALVEALGVSSRELAQHNPAFQASIWQGSKYLPRDYPIRLPRDRLAAPMSQLMAGLPGDAYFAEQLPDLFHTVVAGDTLSQIAREYGTGVSTLVALNNLSSRHRIRAGQQLRLPAAGPLPVTVASVSETPMEPAPPASPEAEVAAVDEVATAVAVPDEVGTLGDDLGSTAEGTLQASLLSDPSDYTVAADGTIEVHPLETLGHFADWLRIRTQRLRDINGLAFRTPVEVGQRIRLDLSRTDAATFEQRRSAYHREQQDAFFRNYRITGVQEHVVKNGESVWVLAQRHYDVPVWLLRQYNPELNLHSVRLGTRLNFPVLAGNDT